MADDRYLEHLEPARKQAVDELRHLITERYPSARVAVKHLRSTSAFRERAGS